MIACVTPFLLVYACVSVAHVREAEAMQWADQTIFAIETYHQAHGAYPSMMEQVAEPSGGPALVREGRLHYVRCDWGFYMDLESEYQFVFPSGWNWDTRSRRWKYYE